MFWPLLLSHLIADYPLQTDGMVEAKKTLPGLTLHVTIHLLTMLVVLFGVLDYDWQIGVPYVLAVAIFHFAIDAWKNVFSARWPHLIIIGYLEDQALHVTSLLLVAFLHARITGAAPFAVRSIWLLYACGYVLVTVVWFITERMFLYQHKQYQDWVDEQMWPRMMSRAVLFTVPLLGWNLWGLLAVLGGLLMHWPDLRGVYHGRALLTDVFAVLVVGSFVMLAAR